MYYDIYKGKKIQEIEIILCNKLYKNFNLKIFNTLH